MPHAPLFAVSLVDTRTGRPHRIGGAVVTLFARRPDEASEELLRNRDPGQWRIEAKAFAPSALA